MTAGQMIRRVFRLPQVGVVLACLAGSALVGAGVAWWTGAAHQRLETTLGAASGTPVGALRWESDDTLLIGVGDRVLRWTAGAVEAGGPDDGSLPGIVAGLPPVPDAAAFGNPPVIVIDPANPLGPPGRNGAAAGSLSADQRVTLLAPGGLGVGPAGVVPVRDGVVALGADGWRMTAENRDPMTRRIENRGIRITRAPTNGGPGPDLNFDLSMVFDAMAATPDGQMFIAGGENGAAFDGGSVYTFDLRQLARTGTDPGSFGVEQHGFDSPTVAVAAGGPAEDRVLAAASRTGEVVVLRRPRFITPELLPLGRFRATKAGLSPLGLREVVIEGTAGLQPVAVSGTGDVVVFYDPVTSSIRRFDVTLGRLGAAEPLVPVLQVPAEDIERRQRVLNIDVMAPLFSNLNVVPGNGIFLALDEIAGPFDATVNAEGTIAAVWSAAGEVGIFPLLLTSIDQVSGGQQNPHVKKIAFGRPADVVVDAAFSPSGGTFALLFSDGTVGTYDLTTQIARTRQLEAPSDGLGDSVDLATSLGFSADGLRIMVRWRIGDTDGNALVPYSLRDLQRLPGPANQILGISHDLAPQADRYVEGDNSRLRVLDTRTGAILLDVLPTLTDRVLLEVSGDGRTIGFGRSGDNAVLLLLDDTNPDLPDSSVSFLDVVLPGPPAQEGLRVSADGSRLLIRLRDGQVMVAETRQTTDPANIGDVIEPAGYSCCHYLSRIATESPAIAAELASDGSFAVVAGADHMIRVVSLVTPDVQTLGPFAGPVRHITLSPDGRRLAAAGIEGELVVVDIARVGRVQGLPMVQAGPRPLPGGMRPRATAAVAPMQPGDGPPDLIVAGPLPTAAQARALVDLMWQGDLARITPAPPPPYRQYDGFYATVNLGAMPLTQARQTLAQVRGLSPETAGAFLHRSGLWCQERPAEPAADFIDCLPPTPPPAAAN